MGRGSRNRLLAKDGRLAAEGEKYLFFEIATRQVGTPKMGRRTNDDEFGATIALFEM